MYRIIIHTILFPIYMYVGVFLMLLFFFPAMIIFYTITGVYFDELRMDAITAAVGFYGVFYVFKFVLTVPMWRRYFRKDYLKYLIIEAFSFAFWSYFYHYFHFLTSDNPILMLIHNAIMIVIIFATTIEIYSRV